MKRFLSLFLALALMVGCLAVLTSCAPEDEGAQINIYLGDQVYDLDPTDYYVDSNAEQVMALLYEPLFSVNEKGKLECAAAKKYTVDRKERKIVIELRESYWSDGMRVTAADFVYAWSERLLNPNNPNPAAALLYDIENAAAIKSASGNYRINDLGAVATGLYELTITYREGADHEMLLKNLASVATSPVRQDRVSSDPTYWSKALNTIVTNGPFSVKTLGFTDGEFTLERNYGYHQEPEIEDFDNNVVPAELHATFTVSGEKVSVSYNDIVNKTKFLMTDAPLSDRANNKGNATLKDDTSVYTYVFNTTKPLFANEKVRQALSLAIDRNAIINAISVGKAADGFLPDVSSSAYNGISSSADIAKAKALIAEVDLNALGSDFTLTVNNDEQSLCIANMVCAAWKELGFNVTVNAVGTVTTEIGADHIIDSTIQYLVKDASLGYINYDVIAVDWQTYSSDAFVGLAAFSSSFCGCGVDFTSNNERRTNISGWSNKDYDYLLNLAFKSNGDDRAKALAEAEKLLVESAPVVPLVFNQSVAYVGSDLSKLEADGFGNWVLNSLKLKDYQNYPGTNGMTKED